MSYKVLKNPQNDKQYLVVDAQGNTISRHKLKKRATAKAYKLNYPGVAAPTTITRDRTCTRKATGDNPRGSKKGGVKVCKGHVDKAVAFTIWRGKDGKFRSTHSKKNLSGTTASPKLRVDEWLESIVKAWKKNDKVELLKGLNYGAVRGYFVGDITDLGPASHFPGLRLNESEADDRINLAKGYGLKKTEYKKPDYAFSNYFFKGKKGKTEHIFNLVLATKVPRKDVPAPMRITVSSEGEKKDAAFWKRLNAMINTTLQKRRLGYQTVDGFGDGLITYEVRGDKVLAVAKIVAWAWGKLAGDSSEKPKVTHQPVKGTAQKTAPKTGNKEGKTLTLKELMGLPADTIQLPYPYSKLLGDPAKNFRMLIWGPSFNGKSSWALRFAGALAESGRKVLYVSVEEGTGPKFRKKITEQGVDIENKNFIVTDITDFAELDKLITNNGIQVVFVDSVNTLPQGEKAFVGWQGKLWAEGLATVGIAQSLKSGEDYIGSSPLRFNADIILKIVNYQPLIEKNR